MDLNVGILFVAGMVGVVWPRVGFAFLFFWAVGLMASK